MRRHCDPYALATELLAAQAIRADCINDTLGQLGHRVSEG